MNNRIFISKTELQKYGELKNLSEEATALLKHQKQNWSLVKDNYEALKKNERKDFHFNGIFVRTQFNPSRIKSTSAKVGKKEIAKRPCFLCENNLPIEQKGINYKNNYVLLVNPYPIFNEHLTIAHHNHIPQSIDDSLMDLLDLSLKLKDKFFVFYNGPKCGASAPDHLHFQAGLKETTPLEKYYKKILGLGKILFEENDIKLTSVEHEFLRILICQSDSKNKINKVFIRIKKRLSRIFNTSDEPLFNIISIYENEKWNLIIIPRQKHRPDQYFAKGSSRILVSPASVDMAGLLITPLREDFEKLGTTEIYDIYKQVSFEGDLSSAFKNQF